jgi:hypothetical protein
MRRCNNVKISADNIQEVADQARALGHACQAIAYEMSQTEQRGLYELIDGLQWEAFESQMEMDALAPPTRASSDAVQSDRLRALLAQVRATGE